MKKAILLSLYFIIGTSCLFSQQYALDSGSIMLSGTANFTKYSGAFYKETEGTGTNLLSLSASGHYFIIPNLILGAGVDFSRLSQREDAFTTISAGPNLGYALGGPESKIFPYIITGYRYNLYEDVVDITGSDIFFGIGAILLGADHVGLDLNVTYHIMNLEPEGGESQSGNVFSVGCGIAGFLF
jgi:hypothetical protein